MKEVVETMKKLIKLSHRETKMIPPNSLRVNLGTSESSSRPWSREDRPQSHDQALLRRSCSPQRHKGLADRVDKNEDKREIDFEDLHNKPQVDSKLVKVSEKIRTFLEESCRRSLPNANRIQTSFWVTKGCGNKNSTAGLLHKDGGQQCHKIYRQRAGKNPDICPRQFNASHLNY